MTRTEEAESLPTQDGDKSGINWAKRSTADAHDILAERPTIQKVPLQHNARHRGINIPNGREHGEAAEDTNRSVQEDNAEKR